MADPKLVCYYVSGPLNGLEEAVSVNRARFVVLLDEAGLQFRDIPVDQARREARYAAVHHRVGDLLVYMARVDFPLKDTVP